MPNVSGSFMGATEILPGVYTYSNVSADQLPTPPTTPPLVYIGFGYGLEPLTPTTFTSSTGLLNALRGGPASTYVPAMTNPSSELPGAGQITFISVGGNTQSSANLVNSSSTTVLTLLSDVYGVPANLYQYEVSAGSVGGINLTIFDGYTSDTAEGLNLGIPFQMAYTGTASGVTYSVTVSGGVATAFTTSSPNPGESLNIPLGSSTYPTVSSLVQYLNGTGFYVANVVSSTGGNLPSTSLDAASALSLPVSGTSLNYVNVTSILPDIAYWVNQYSGLATASIPSGVTSSPTQIPSDVPLTHFTGGSSTPPTSTDYANGFNVALTVPAWVVFADSNSAAVMALGQQHVATANTITERKFRRFVTGSSIGDSVTVTTSNARNLNSQAVTYVYPGIYQTSTSTGVQTLYSGLYTAAMIAGIMCGAPINTPLTAKTLNGTGLEVDLTTSQIQTLQNSGVLAVRLPHSTGVPTTCMDVTTWQNNNNGANIFNQQVACNFYLQLALIYGLQPYIGGIAAGSGSTLVKAKQSATYLLNSEVYSESNPMGVLASWDPSSLSLTYNGQTRTLSVSVNVVLVNQIDFINVTTNILPLTASL